MRQFMNIVEAANHPHAQLVVDVIGMKADSLRKFLDPMKRNGISYTEQKRIAASKFFVQGQARMLQEVQRLLEKHGFVCHFSTIMESVLTEAKSVLIEHVTLKGGTPAKVQVRPSDITNCYWVDCRVKLPTGKWIHAGSGHFGENDWDGSPGEWSAMQMHVNEEWKRKGIATAMYDAMEKIVAPGRVVPEPRYHKRSTEANAFWRARDPKNYGNW